MIERKKSYKWLNLIICIALIAQTSPLSALSHQTVTHADNSQSKTYQPYKITEVQKTTNSSNLESMTPNPHPAPKPSQPQAIPPSPYQFTASTPTPKNQHKTSKPRQQADTPINELPIFPDWNLLSIPREQTNTDPAAVFASITNNTNVIYAYDGCNSADPWQVFDPDAPPINNDLTTITPTIGFWLQATTETTLPLNGTVPPSTTIPLCEGWNLIGMPTKQPRPIQNALFSINGKYSRVFGYNPTNTTDTWLIYDVTAPEWANDLQTMYPGQGYWILANEPVTLTIFNQGQPPVATLISPQEDNPEIIPISYITDVIGTAYSDFLQSWTLSYRPHDEDIWTSFATGITPIFTDTLDQFDPTLLLNGLYEIRLTVLDYNDDFVQAFSDVIVDGRAKVGNLTLSFVDIEVPIAGMPIRAIRSYDSRDKRLGDFGIGWTLTLDDIRLEESAPPGDGWLSALGEVSENPLLPFFDYCLPPSLPHVVTITFPDDNVYNFRPTISPQCQLLIPHTIVNITYEPLPGTRGQLIPLDQSGENLLVVGGNPAPPYDFGDGPLGSFDPVPNQFWNQDIVGLHDPNLYKLILPNGTEYIISQQDGLQSITARNGDTLFISQEGLTHSKGKSIDIIRDDLGRITQITDPLSQTVQYKYDERGDLVQVINQAGLTTTFTYDDNHYLLDIYGPTNTLTSRHEYDENGRLISSFDADGQAISYDHNLNDRRETITDRRGYKTHIEYDTNGNYLRVTNALSDTIEYTYNENSEWLTFTDPLGHTITRTYDSQGNLTHEIDQLGHVITRTHNNFGQVTTHTDSQGTIAITYNDQGFITNIFDTISRTISLTYDANSNLTSVTAPDGSIKRYEYNTFGERTKVIDFRGNVTTYTYDANGNLKTQTTVRTDANGITHTLTTERHYDALGRLVEQIDPGGGFTRIEYTPLGKVKARNENGYRTENHYDSLGNLTNILYPDGTQESYTYDPEGNITRKIERDGNTFLYEFSPLGQLIRTENADGTFSTLEYNAVGRVIAEVDENGNRIETEYDARGSKTAVTNPLSQTTYFVYDADRRLIRVTDPLSHTTNFEYDAAGRRTRTIFPDNTSETLIFNEFECNAVIERTDQAGITTRFEYDPHLNLTKVIDPLNNETTYTYDELSNKLTQTDANGHTTRWAYDNLNRIISRTLPLGMTEQFVFAPNGNLLSQTDFNSNTITYTYDINNYVETKNYPDGTTISITNGPLGQLQTVVDSLGTTQYTYDERSRLIQINYPGSGFINYDYDGVGNRITTTAPSGTTTYIYDALNRIKSVTDPVGITTYTYDDVGNPSQAVYPNGTITQFTFNSLNKLTKLENRRADFSLISSYDYTLGPSGNRLGVLQGNGQTITYTYDSLYRLTSETTTPFLGNSSTISYTYDSVGNLINKTDNGISLNYTYNDNDQLTQVGNTTYLYDLNGNTTRQIGLTSTITYEYNFDNDLVKATTPTGITEHVYDFRGIRTSTSYNGVVTNYLVDANRQYEQVLEERDSTNNLIKRYVYGLDLIAHQHTGTNYFYHYDGLGSTRALSDDSQNIAEQYTYDAYGTLQDGTSATLTDRLFVGEQFDANLNHYFLRARYYVPQNGRFLTMDAFPGLDNQPLSLNKYLYAHANPVGLTDLSGNQVTVQELNLGMAILTTLFAIQAIVISSNSNAVITWDDVPEDFEFPDIEVPTNLLTKIENITLRLAAAGLIACIATGMYLNIGFKSDDPCGLGDKDIFISGNDTPATTRHIFDTMLAQPQFIFLHRATPVPWDRGWYNSLPPCKENVQAESGEDCDEYPFNSTWQGGPWGFFYIDLRLIDSKDNQDNGRALRFRFYDPCNIGNGQVFAVFPQLREPTRGHCS